MRGKELPRRAVYLELLDSLLDPQGGAGKMSHRLRRDFPSLFDEGWEIERWGLRRWKPASRASESFPVRGPRFPLKSFPRVLLPPMVWITHLIQSLRKPRVGILIAYSPVAGTGAAIARLVRRRSPALVIRIISDFSARTRDLYGRPREFRILRALEQFVLRRADLVIPMGAFTHQIAVQAGVPQERILDLPLPAPFFRAELPPETAGQPRVVAAGRLVPEKGFDVLVGAFATVADEFPEAILDFAGDGPQRSDLELLAASLGLGHRVRFRGWVPPQAMPAFYGGAIGAVLPSRINEGFGMVLVEAGLAGCALLGSDVGGIRDIVLPGRTGILVPPSDPMALAEALRSLLSDPQEARRLGAGARDVAQAYVDGRDDALRRSRERLEALRAGLPG